VNPKRDKMRTMPNKNPRKDAPARRGLWNKASSRMMMIRRRMRIRIERIRCFHFMVLGEECSGEKLFPHFVSFDGCHKTM